VIGRLVFRHDFLRSYGWVAFVADVVSLTIAGVVIGLIVSIAALLATRKRRGAGAP